MLKRKRSVSPPAASPAALPAPPQPLVAPAVSAAPTSAPVLPLPLRPEFPAPPRTAAQLRATYHPPPLTGAIVSAGVGGGIPSPVCALIAGYASGPPALHTTAEGVYLCVDRSVGRSGTASVLFVPLHVLHDDAPKKAPAAVSAAAAAGAALASARSPRVTPYAGAAARDPPCVVRMHFEVRGKHARRYGGTRVTFGALCAQVMAVRRNGQLHLPATHVHGRICVPRAWDYSISRQLMAIQTVVRADAPPNTTPTPLPPPKVAAATAATTTASLPPPPPLLSAATALWIGNADVEGLATGQAMSGDVQSGVLPAVPNDPAALRAAYRPIVWPTTRRERRGADPPRVLRWSTGDQAVAFAAEDARTTPHDLALVADAAQPLADSDGGWTRWGRVWASEERCGAEEPQRYSSHAMWDIGAGARPLDLSAALNPYLSVIPLRGLNVPALRAVVQAMPPCANDSSDDAVFHFDEFCAQAERLLAAATAAAARQPPGSECAAPASAHFGLRPMAGGTEGLRLALVVDADAAPPRPPPPQQSPPRQWVTHELTLLGVMWSSPEVSGVARVSHDAQWVDFHCASASRLHEQLLERTLRADQVWRRDKLRVRAAQQSAQAIPYLSEFVYDTDSPSDPDSDGYERAAAAGSAPIAVDAGAGHDPDAAATADDDALAGRGGWHAFGDALSGELERDGLCDPNAPLDADADTAAAPAKAASAEGEIDYELDACQAFRFFTFAEIEAYAEAHRQRRQALRTAGDADRRQWSLF